MVLQIVRCSPVEEMFSVHSSELWMIGGGTLQPCGPDEQATGWGWTLQQTR